MPILYQSGLAFFQLVQHIFFLNISLYVQRVHMYEGQVI